jgi:hypothetical protein
MPTTLFDEEDNRQTYEQRDELAVAEVVDVTESDAISRGLGGNLVQVATMSEAITPEQIAIAASVIESRIDAFKTIMQMLLRLTNYEDWVAHRNIERNTAVLYLEATGANKISGALEIDMDLKTISKEVHTDGRYEYVCIGRTRACSISSNWMPIVASRYAADPFFTRGKPWEEAVISIDPGDVRKSAMTNFHRACVVKACGLETVTYEDLKAAGVPVDKIAVIGHQSGGYKKTMNGSGDKMDLLKGSHIKISINKNDTTTQAAVKSITGRHWTGAPDYVWIIPFNSLNVDKMESLRGTAEQGFSFEVVEKP